MVQFAGENAMPATVARQEDHLPPGQLSDQEISSTYALFTDLQTYVDQRSFTLGQQYVSDGAIAHTLREGNTPLYELPRCAQIARVDNLQAKHQGMNPTASFKDTGMTVAASSAHERGFRWVACASTGNTSASMAAYAARANMHSLVLIPEGKISWGKLSQSLDYGALTCQLRTDFDGCVRILNELVRQKPVYLLNSVNPYRIEGQKTAAIELMEQLEWEPPDHIIVPGGNLGNSSAIGKALLEMHDLKLRIRNELVPGLGNARRKWEVKLPEDEDPESYIQPFSDLLSALERQFPSDASVAAAVVNEMMLVQRWIEDTLQDIAERGEQGEQQHRPGLDQHVPAEDQRFHFEGP